MSAFKNESPIKNQPLPAMNDPQKTYPYPQPQLARQPNPAAQPPNPAPPLKVLPSPDSQSPASGQQALSGGEGELATVNPQTPQTDAASQPKRRRRTGKIARLKKVDRDRLNQMLRDGEPYADILEKLGEPAKHITVQNVSDWSRGGYLDWESDQEWLEESQAEMEVALDVGMECDARKVNQSVIQIAVLKVFQGLRKMGLDTMDEKRLTDPAVFARVANALARLSREGLNLQKHGEAAAKAVAAELKRLDPKRELTDREDEIITAKMDDYFLKPRRRRKPDPANTTPPTLPPSPLAAASPQPAVAHAQEPERHPTQPPVPAPAFPVKAPTPATAPLAAPPSP